MCGGAHRAEVSLSVHYKPTCKCVGSLPRGRSLFICTYTCRIYVINTALALYGSYWAYTLADPDGDAPPTSFTSQHVHVLFGFWARIKWPESTQVTAQDFDPGNRKF